MGFLKAFQDCENLVRLQYEICQLCSFSLNEFAFGIFDLLFLTMNYCADLKEEN